MKYECILQAVCARILLPTVCVPVFIFNLTPTAKNVCFSMAN